MTDGGTLTIETQAVELDDSNVGQHIGARSGPHIVLAVSDTGAGMDERTQKRIFEPFFTTKGIGKGTGLGLSTVYGIVKQSGGNILVTSEPGKGTMFKIYLPQIVGAEQEYKRRTEEGASLSGSETILLAEDEEIVRELARQVLEKQGYRVIAAPNGAAALMMSGSHQGPIHLLISDLIMPDIGGGELASRLVKLRPEIKVLYMSGYTGETIAHYGIVDSSVALLQKPFTLQELARRVRDVLGPRSGPGTCEDNSQ
jgi:CheY-like chemotaxis protein